MRDGSRDLARRALAEILVLTGLCLIGILVFSGLGLGLASLLFEVGLEDLQNWVGMESFGGKGRVSLLIVQGVISLGGFVAMPSLIRWLMPGTPFGRNPSYAPNTTMLLLVLGLALLMMPVNAWLSVWNQNLHFPSFLQGFERWALEKEKEMENLTLFLVRFSTPVEALVGFLVISIIAGFSEEFFFRRLLQPRVYGLTRNMHVAIWLTAFVFSAIHIQFYGLLPRMVLGALFGYYFWWTGNYWIPVMGHILNNGITLTGMYLYQVDISPINVEDPRQIPWFLGAVSAGMAWSLATMVKEEADKIRIRRQTDSREEVHFHRF